VFLSTPYPEIHKWLLEFCLLSLATGICDSKPGSLELEYPCTSITPCSGLHLKPNQTDAFYRLYKLRGHHGEGCCKTAEEPKALFHSHIVVCKIMVLSQRL